MGIGASLVELDTSLRLLIVAHRLPFLTPIMAAASVVGRGGAVWLATGVALTVARKVSRGGFLQLAIAILLASIVADQVIKPLAGRDRPFVRAPEVQVIGSRPHDGSFPSGHSANAFASAFVLSRLLPAATVLWWAMAIAIAYSRVYLGVHYPFDVVAGAATGILCGFLVSACWRRLSGPVAPPQP